MDVTSSSLTAAGGGFRSPCLHVAVGDVGAVFELGEVFIQVVSRALPVLIRGGVLLVHPGAQFSQPDQQRSHFVPIVAQPCSSSR